MFERFTDRAQRAFVLALEEAATLPSAHVGTEHLLLGLLAEEDNMARRVLSGLGVTLEAARAAVAEVSPPEPAGSPDPLPFTPRARKVLEQLALREALELGQNYVAPQHVLLGVIRDRENRGAQVLARLGHSGPEVRQAVLAALGVRQGAEARHPRSEHKAGPALAELADMIANLDAYIERRAAEIAAEAVARAERIEAAARNRIPDLQREQARQVDALERRIEQLERDLSAAQEALRRAVEGQADA